MMRMNLSFLAAAALCGCAAGGPAEQPAVNVASYNIRSFRGMDGARDIDRTIAAIAGLQCDICGLQEVRKTAADAEPPIEIAAQRLGMKAFFAQTLDRPDFIYGIGILSRYPFEVVETLTLPIPEGHEPRTAIIARIDHPQGAFYFINTHLSAYQNDAGREKQLELILDTVRARNYTPAILVGDLNSKPESKTIKLLLEDWEVFGDAAFTCPAQNPTMRIDYIAAYPKGAFRDRSYEVVNDETSSDHRPIKAQLTLPPSGSGQNPGKADPE